MNPNSVVAGHFYKLAFQTTLSLGSWSTPAISAFRIATSVPSTRTALNFAGFPLFQAVSQIQKEPVPQGVQASIQRCSRIYPNQSLFTRCTGVGHASEIKRHTTARKCWPRRHLARNHILRHEEVSSSHSPDPAPCPPLVPDDLQSTILLNRAACHQDQVQGFADVDRLYPHVLIRLSRFD
jgi:hypothetical protein